MVSVDVNIVGISAVLIMETTVHNSLKCVWGGGLYSN